MKARMIVSYDGKRIRNLAGIIVNYPGVYFEKLKKQ
jgi:hypothetical protein